MNNQNLIQKLQQCAATCLYCADACLDEENVKMMVRCIRLDRDCAEICTATANFLSRNSQNAGGLIRLCADICRQCGQECQKHQSDHCQQCAKACFECAEACSQYAG